VQYECWLTYSTVTFVTSFVNMSFLVLVFFDLGHTIDYSISLYEPTFLHILSSVLGS
jgi:hypothetical protein